MSQKETITRYSLIINKLRKCPASFQEIFDFLDSKSEDFDYRISIRTFQRDIKDIYDLYKIHIEFDKSGQKYHIASEDKPEATERLLSAFDTFNALGIADRLSDFIHFDTRRPKGTENLFGLVHAIKDRLQINFTYHDFRKDSTYPVTLNPYALKEFEHRWYILGNVVGKNHIRTFGLDRITAFEITNKHFDAQDDFSVNENFKNCFGIIGPGNAEPEEVILSFDKFQGQYIKTLPLHSSQKIISDTDEGLQISLNIIPTYDFHIQLLSLGARVIVIKPESLIVTLKTEFQNALAHYA